MQGTPLKSAQRLHAIFLDIDGTYADFGIVPEAHVAAVRGARAAGHKVLLCTGRPLSMLPASILAAGFDGLVASAGAYVEIGGNVLMDRRLSDRLAERAIAALDEYGAIYVLEAPEALYVPPMVEKPLSAIIDSHFSVGPEGEPTGAEAILESLRPWAVGEASFAKISVFDARVPVRQIAATIGEGVAVVENSISAASRHSGELFGRGVSKADGVHVALAALGMELADTIAFGDGENDLEMIAMAGLGVAIENSHSGLLALADRTTPPPSREGIAVAFRELGLI